MLYPKTATQIATAVGGGEQPCTTANIMQEIGLKAKQDEFQGKQAESVEKIKGKESASCRARTYDPLIKSQLLYQLS
jgi:hypothetical protein